MIGSAIGAGIQVAGSIFGGLQAAKAARAQKKRVQKQMRENEDWYNRRYNEDSTQRADAQRMMAQMDQRMQERNKSAAGRAAVMGGTEEAMAAEREANASAMADTMSQIAVAGEASKNAIEQQYQQTKAGLNEQLNSIDAQRAKGITEAIQGVTSAAGSMGGALGDLLSGGKKK